MNDLTELGRLATERQDAAADQIVDLEAARRRFIEAPQAPASGRTRAAWLLAAAVALLAGLALAVFRMDRTEAQLTFQVGERRAAGEVDAWLASPAAAPLPLGFSDGTTVSLEPSARARVTRIGSAGATLLVESGGARLSVVKRKDAAWQVSLGPFRVDVTGTRFDVDWDPRTERLSLDMHEGSVLVSGCVFGAGRPFVAGESMRASCREKHVEIFSNREDPAGARPASSASAIPLVPPPATPGVAIDASPAPVESRPLPGASPSGKTPAAAAPGWRELVRTGRHGEALDLAEAAGFSAECAAASAADLVALGDAARYLGRLERATEAYQTARRRFPGNERSAVAAFALGRIAFDQRGSYADAARWFRTYLAEEPGGRLARDALGRLLESLQRSGDVSGARREAARYLEQYPAGPHAEFARRLARE